MWMANKSCENVQRMVVRAQNYMYEKVKCAVNSGITRYNSVQNTLVCDLYL